MLSAKIKDIKFRKAYNQTEKKRRLNKFLFINLLNNKKNNFEKLKSVTPQFITKLHYNSKVRLTRRCVLNNRSRGVLRLFGVSRIQLRDMMQFGLIPGYSKAVW
jgi:ribosomal protein S14